MSPSALRLLALPLVLFSSLTWGDEVADLKARIVQLEATVQELTLQLAESLKAQQRMEATLAAGTASASAMAQKVDATLEETAISEETASLTSEAVTAYGATTAAIDGCDVQAALRGYEGSGDDNKALSAWLRESNQVEKCTTAQLKQIREAVDWDLLGYQKQVLAVIDQELARR